MLGMNANAQTAAKKVKIACITTSCCGIGPFGFEIWSEKTCVYVSAEKSGNQSKVLYSFKSKETLSEVTVKEDVILAGQFAENGDNLILPIGKYTVKDGQIEFTPKTAKPTKYCYIREVSGNILGHEYEYTIKICITVELSKGVVAITPKLSSDELSQILKSTSQSFEIKNDIVIREDGLNYTIKSGKYIMNEDGNAYIQNVNVR